MDIVKGDKRVAFVCVVGECPLARGGEVDRGFSPPCGGPTPPSLVACRRLGGPPTLLRGQAFQGG